jgi:hypothetical protein
VSPAKLIEGRGGGEGGWGRSLRIQRRKSLALYKSFNILCIIPRNREEGKQSGEHFFSFWECVSYSIETLPLPLNIFIFIVRKRPERRKSRRKESLYGRSVHVGLAGM